MSSAERNRRWREANPEQVAAYKESRRIPPTELTCTECGDTFYGRKDRLACSRRCKDRRYRRLTGDVPRERAGKHARRRARKRGGA